MTNRDMLIELLSATHTETDDYKEQARLHDEYIADRILTDGWTRLPVRVGSKVYKISRNKVKECEIVFVGISADEKCSHFNFVEYYADGTFYKSYSMTFDEIGKTVFLTREEAEAKLEELNTNER